MNPFAKKMRTDKSVRSRILGMLRRNSSVIEPTSVNELIATLEDVSLAHPLSNATFYIVGGDGTFNQVLNWILSKPAQHRPRLLPVGGGQFNFMARHLGLASRDPSVNLAQIFSGRLTLQPEFWRPIQVYDSLSNTVCYAAVIGNGVLCDACEWYEEMGKGNHLEISRLIARACKDHVLSLIQDRPGRLKLVKGRLQIDNFRVPGAFFTAMLIGTTQELIPSCKPFRQPVESDACAILAHWGGLEELALSVPFLWTGVRSPLTDSASFNGSANRITLETQDNRLMMDGDLIRFPSPTTAHHEHIFTITRGPEITLMRAT